ncbi:MAG: hypothetical protein U0228_22995 [Myxococcaceae bacterium]
MRRSGLEASGVVTPPHPDPLLLGRRGSLLLLFVLATPAFAGETGTVCLRVATWSFPKGASMPGATPHPIKRFTVQVDEGEAHDVTERAWLLEGLALEGKHTVRVRGDGTLRETFFFTFKDRGPTLELTYVGFYDSWRLGAAKKPCPVPAP